MATIGRPIGVPGHTTQKLDAPDDLDTGTANSFTMKVGGVAVSPDEASLAVYVSNVRQIPGVAYTVSGSTLTFTGTVTTSNYSYAIIMGDAMYVENNSVDESKLKISNGPTNGQFLSAQSGDTGGLTWASVSAAPVTALNNATANELVTVGDTTTELDAESGLTFASNVLTVTGDILPEANGTRDLGTSSYRWRNIYTSDLDLSNESRKDEGGNEVDGTWGAYTIQEGEDDLFLINRRSGKRYKFNLTEVD